MIYSHNVGEVVGLLYSCQKTFSLVATERKMPSHLILLTALTRLCFAISAGLLKDSEKESTCCLRGPAPISLKELQKPVSWEWQCMQAHREFVSHFCIRLSNLGCSI